MRRAFLGLIVLVATGFGGYHAKDVFDGLKDDARYAQFLETVRVNPNSWELKTAVALYTQETGKSQNEMSYEDICEYTLRVRGR